MRETIKLSAKQGRINRERFNRLVAPLERKIWALSLSLTGDPEEADDLLQETLLKAYRFMHKFDGDNVMAWVLTICRNNYINDYRKIKKLPKFVDYTDFVQCEDHPLYVRDEGLGDEMTTVLDNIDPIFKTPFLMAHLSGYQYQEISKISGVKVGTVRSRIYRAKEILKEAL
jgi:RNA polymerase sigma-70 factor (ECF subfamily)